MKLSEKQFIELKLAQKQDISSKSIASELELSLDIVNVVYGIKTYNEFLDEVEEKQRTEIINPARAGYYKHLLAKKEEQNEDLQKTRDWLIEQVYFLRKSIAFLETRKRLLEDGISGLERNIGIGVSLMKDIEDNEEFKKLSAKK